MYYVYIIKSLTNGKLYTGFTRDLKSRFKKHKGRGVHTTKRMGELSLIFYEAFKSEEDAKRRELYLKTSKGKRALKLMLKDSRGPVV